MLSRGDGRRILQRRVLRDLGQDVSVPSYDSRELRPGLVHVGLGRFHRAHQAAYLDRLAEEGVSRDWGVVGVGMQTGETLRALARQDHLYTLAQCRDDGTTVRVAGHLQRSLFAPTQLPAVMDVLSHADTKVVSLTVTAPVYLRPPDADNVFAVLAQALQRRRTAGTRPFTVMSCDNVPGNGDATRAQVLAAADRLGDGLSAWIERTVSFPSSMVDRITPPLGDDVRRELRERLGVDDECAVVSERFSQWVVEDDFCNERPPLDLVGALFVRDARPYRTVKARLLNGSHCALGYLGSLAGHSTTAEAMDDPFMRSFVERMMQEEVAPTLAATSPVDLRAYQRSTLDRLQSTALADPVERLCARGSVRIPNYVLPSLNDALRRRTPHRLLTLVVAGWVARLRRRPACPDPTDPAAEMLQALARQCGTDVRPLVGQRAVFGDLVENTSWVGELESALVAIEQRGVRAAVGEALTAAHGAAAPAAWPSTEGPTHAEAS